MNDETMPEKINAWETPKNGHIGRWYEPEYMVNPPMAVSYTKTSLINEKRDELLEMVEGCRMLIPDQATRRLLERVRINNSAIDDVLEIIKEAYSE